MDNLKIFVSHNTKYVDIAKSLKLSLQALESKTRLDVKISEEMAGAPTGDNGSRKTYEVPIYFCCFSRMPAWT